MLNRQEMINSQHFLPLMTENPLQVRSETRCFQKNTLLKNIPRIVQVEDLVPHSPPDIDQEILDSVIQNEVDAIVTE